MSGLGSMCLWLANRKIHLRRVSEEELRQLANTGLPDATAIRNIGSQQGGVDEDDRKMPATVFHDGIFGNLLDNDNMVAANSPITVEHVVQQKVVRCASLSSVSRKRRRMDPPESGASKKGRHVKGVNDWGR